MFLACGKLYSPVGWMFQGGRETDQTKKTDTFTFCEETHDKFLELVKLNEFFSSFNSLTVAATINLPPPPPRRSSPVKGGGGRATDDGGK